MTTTRTLAIYTRWGHANTTTSTFHRHLKRHKPTETYLFDLLPQDILAEINSLASVLDHRNKLMAAIIKIYHLFNPIIFAIPQYLWAPYHNFRVYECLYNECCYTWAYR